MFFLRKHLPGHSASAAHGGLSEVSLPPLPSQLPRLPSAPSLQRQLRKVLEHHEVIEARQALLRRDLQELMQMLPPEAAEDTIVDGKKQLSHSD
ncbi:unnamed protein product [Cladocopium goreaui]|uniref:Uncharacterized protein n=1 Tax=Cladocopium goreaui TaxID=2562237 RepID=A0A9P1D8P4_9DINO|nr:unnamed protein product [Cladocopium goreaui]